LQSSNRIADEIRSCAFHFSSAEALLDID